MTRFPRIRIAFISALPMAAGLGCATVNPSPELVEARTEYQKASQDQTHTLNPAGLYEAKKYLDTANQAFEKDPKSDYSRDVAYIALRKVELAEVQARTAAANQSQTEAERAKAKATELALADSRSKLNQSNQELGRTNEQLAATSNQLQKTNEQLEAEKQARMDADRRAEEATANLAKIASIKQEPRGLVITLSGSVLFASGKSALLSNARPKLDEVADALKKSEAASFVVEGYTDSRGSDSTNQDLSLRRAQTVRDYLVQGGVPSEKITATGYGSAKPVADNKTAEGRANNRRVEIVLGRAQADRAMTSGTDTSAHQ